MLTLAACHNLLKSDEPQEQIIKFFRDEFRKPENFETFCRFFFASAFTTPFAPVHTETIEEFMSNENNARALPRGHGKSTLIGLGLVTWWIVNEMKHYLVYTSQSHTKSEAFLEPVRTACKYNQLLRWVYPDLDPKNVTDEDSGKDRTDLFDVKKTRIQAISFEKNIRGLRSGTYRPDIIIFDDIEDDDRVTNPVLRAKDEDKLNGAIIPALAVTGCYKFIGTILHLDSLLMKKIKQCNGKIYEAAVGDVTKAYERGKLRRNKEVVPEELGTWRSILCPDLWSAERLDDMAYEIGTRKFENEYMNNPIDDAKSIIQREWIHDARDETLSYFDPIKADFSVIGADFAFSDRAKADKSAYALLHKHRVVEHDWEGYTIGAAIWLEGKTTTQQFDLLQYYSDSWNVHDCALEENSIRSMSNELLTYTFPRTLFWTAANDPSPEALQKRKEENRNTDLKRYTIGKLKYIERMGTQFENHRIRLPYKTEADRRITDAIEAELVTFARKDGLLVETGVHSDMGIAIALALERAEMETKEIAWSIG